MKNISQPETVLLSFFYHLICIAAHQRSRHQFAENRFVHAIASSRLQRSSTSSPRCGLLFTFGGEGVFQCNLAYLFSLTHLLSVTVNIRVDLLIRCSPINLFSLVSLSPIFLSFSLVKLRLTTFNKRTHLFHKSYPLNLHLPLLHQDPIHLTWQIHGHLTSITP